MLRGNVTREMFDYVPELQFDSGYRYFLGNMDNYAQALMSILKSIKAKLPLLQSMLMTDELEGLRTITQTLRKMLGNVGAIELSDSIYRLELTLLNEETKVVQEELTTCITSLLEFSEHLEMLFKNLNMQSSKKQEEEQVSYFNFDFTKTKESIKLSSNLLERKII